MRFLVSCIFQFYGFRKLSSFQFSRFLSECKMRFSWFSMFLHFKHSPEFSKAKRTQKNKQNWRTRERMATRMLCFRDGVCVLVQFWPCLLFLFLVSCPARAHFLFLCLCWCLGSLSLPFLFFSVSISVVSSLLRLALVGARPHPAERVATPSCPPCP